jgi:hypothetical protein
MFDSLTQPNGPFLPEARPLPPVVQLVAPAPQQQQPHQARSPCKHAAGGEVRSKHGEHPKAGATAQIAAPSIFGKSDNGPSIFSKSDSGPSIFSKSDSGPSIFRKPKSFRQRAALLPPQQQLGQEWLDLGDSWAELQSHPCSAS